LGAMYGTSKGTFLKSTTRDGFTPPPTQKAKRVTKRGSCSYENTSTLFVPRHGRVRAIPGGCAPPSPPVKAHSANEHKIPNSLFIRLYY
jgi:hypothetical protein